MKNITLIQRSHPGRTAAFTLIEMIGVLAVIAILAALLVPKVFSAISDARVNSVCINCSTIKTAIADHAGKYGKLDQIFGTNSVQFASNISAGYDTNVLLAEGLIDAPFTTKIASSPNSQGNSTIQIVQGGHENNNSANGYRLDGVNNGTAGAQYVIEAMLLNVSAQDAKDLNDRLDGPSMGAVDLTTRDSMGRVEYAAPVNGTTTVYVYITHR